MNPLPYIYIYLCISWFLSLENSDVSLLSLEDAGMAKRLPDFWAEFLATAIVF